MAYVTQLLEEWSAHIIVREVETIFRRLVLHDVSLRIAGVVTDKQAMEGENRVECDVSIESVDGEQLVRGRAVVLLPKRGDSRRAALHWPAFRQCRASP